MSNPFVHLELNSTDVSRAKDFYGKLFSWSLEDNDMGGGMMYTMIRPGEGPGGGMMQHPVPGAPSIWLVYVNVDDLDATVAKVRQLGGKILKDVSDVPGMGRFSIVEDPTGAALGLWQPAAR